MDIKRFMWVNKEGAIVGGVVGFLVYKFYPQIVNEFFMTKTAEQSIGLIDSLKSALPVTDFIQFKIMMVCILIGASVGILIDSIYKPNK